MKQEKYPNARQHDLVVQKINEGFLVYNLKTDRVFCLNETSAAIWQLCNGKNDIADIAEQFQKQSNQYIPIELVELALENLDKENLLESYQPRALVDKTSRRAMIRKIGLATAIALPVIASIIAPTAVHAVSCTPGTTFCTLTFIGSFSIPAGCDDLKNGFVTPFGQRCGSCGGFCTLTQTCVNGICII